MNQIGEAFNDIATEITPVDPPVELTMRRGRRIRNGRLAAAVGGTAGTIVIAAGIALGVPALTGHGGVANQAVAAAPVAEHAALVRPVFLEAAFGSTTAHGDASLVNAATRKLFNRLVCQPGPNATTVDNSWKGSVGWTQGTDQWDNPNNQIVSCDANGGKYVLGPAVFTGADLTGVTAGILPNSKQWVVNLTLDSKASAAFGALTTKQANDYYPGSEQGNADDAVLDQTAFLLDGNVLEAPETQGALTSGLFVVTGPQPDGFTQAQAEALAARV